MSRLELFTVSMATLGALTAGYWLSGLVGDLRAGFVSRRRQRVMQVLGAVIFGSDAEAEAVYERVPDLPRRHLLAVMAGLSADLDGEAAERVRRVVRTSGLARFIRRRVTARRWRLRIQAAQLHHLIDHPDFDRVVLFSDRHPLVRARAVEVLTPELARTHLGDLERLLGDEDPLVALAVREALVRAGTAAVDLLRRHLEAGGATVVPVLEVVALLDDPRLIAPATAYVADPDPAIRALVARALGQVGGVEGLTDLYTLLADDDEATRAAAVNSLARLGSVASVSRLGPMLEDPSFLVRRRAGAALDQLGAPGRLALRRQLHSDDDFARDMARQVLDIAAGRLGVERVPTMMEGPAMAREADPYLEAIQALERRRRDGDVDGGGDVDGRVHGDRGVGVDGRVHGDRGVGVDGRCDRRIEGGGFEEVSVTVGVVSVRDVVEARLAQREGSER